ncbi:MAG: hypothetical protein KY476_22160 [Planctomycetes bacterium]|nr:hypothetical protein [Planctomycetota bacterium]
MGTREQHRKKADRNQAFIDEIRDSKFTEWIAIAVFYKAVHVIEEMLAVSGSHATSHRQRQAILKAKYPEILRPFRTLYNFALVSRYQFRPVKTAQVEMLFHALERLEQLAKLEIEEGSYSG